MYEELITLVSTGAKKATIIISPTYTVKATLQGVRCKRAKTVTILITSGSPNYAERQKIAKAKKAKLKFPLPIELKF